MNKLVAIVGMSGSGKSIASDYLENKGWAKIYFGGVVLEEVKKRGLEITSSNEKLVREDLRKKHGMAAMAIILLPRIKESIKSKDTVLDGLYSWDELKVLKEELGNKLQLICVITDKEIRYERVSKRPVRPLDREEIEIRDIAEIENLAKGGPVAFADYFILNNGELGEYHKRLEEIISLIDKKGDK